MCDFSRWARLLQSTGSIQEDGNGKRDDHHAAADIVSAHVSNNPVSTADMPNLIKSVYDALAHAGQQTPVVEERQEPVVSIRSSVKPDAIACLECGKKFKMLKRHLNNDHGLTPAEYRSKWNLAADYPIVAPNYAELRKQLAVKIGLGRKPGSGRKPGRKMSPPTARS